MRSRSGVRLVPGLSAALAARVRYYDGAFHRPIGCGWCAQLADIRAGAPVELPYADIRALMGLPYPDDRTDDRRLYEIRGDLMTPAAEG